MNYKSQLKIKNTSQELPTDFDSHLIKINNVWASNLVKKLKIDFTIKLLKLKYRQQISSNIQSISETFIATIDKNKNFVPLFNFWFLVEQKRF